MPTFLGRLAALAALGLLPAALAQSGDACAKIAGKDFVLPADALACLKSFPFNETIRANVLDVVTGLFKLYTFEPYYLNSPHPYEDSTVSISDKFAELNRTSYDTDYDFHKALFDFSNSLHDAHTIWLSACHTQYQTILPTPIVAFEQDGEESIFVAPDSVELISQLGANYTSQLEALNFDWKRLAGAKVVEIEGAPAWDYVEDFAHKRGSGFLDLNIRISTAFSSYTIYQNEYYQKVGGVAGLRFPERDALTLQVVVKNATEAETVKVPYVSAYLGKPFTNKDDFWDNNCKADNTTNGVDLKEEKPDGLFRLKQQMPRRFLKSEVIDESIKKTILPLPSQFRPSLAPLNGSEGVVKSYVLPDNKTGVLFVGSFYPDDPWAFFPDVASSVKLIKEAGAQQLLVDVTNNGGGYVTLGAFLQLYLMGSKSLRSFPNPGFQTAIRVGPLAQKIVESAIALNITSELSYYAPDNWLFPNNTKFPFTHNYLSNVTKKEINGQEYLESERFLDGFYELLGVDIPEEAQFDPTNIAIVGNGQCASTCAHFTTVMYERHNTTLAVYGGKPGLPMEYKGVAGAQVLEWPDIDTELRTVNLKPGTEWAIADLLVAGQAAVNWRTAYSFVDENAPIAYHPEYPQTRIPYTAETYNNPQKLWISAAEKLFG
ncbi:hypothetical protein BD413DRAFT_35102 [Trametes elegans]|nr:hypothetical protein BD413DRAFT_35102 [Trametes elegans]